MITAPIPILAFPFAGGAAHCFAPIQRAMPAAWAMETLELPGHGRRMREPLLVSLEAVADDLLSTVRRRAHAGPYALFGHSMGARLVAITLRRLLHNGDPLPLHVTVSGARAPHLPCRPGVSHLPDAQFVDKVAELGGMPASFQSSPAMMEIFLPILRADFAAVERYRHPAPTGAALPLSVLRGEDEAVSSDEAEAWAEDNGAPVTVRSYPGGHFFLLEHAVDVAAHLVCDLERELDRTSLVTA